MRSAESGDRRSAWPLLLLLLASPRCDQAGAAAGGLPNPAPIVPSRELYSVGVQTELPDGRRQVLQVPIDVGQSVKAAVQRFCAQEEYCRGDQPVQRQFEDIISATLNRQRAHLYPNALLQDILESKEVRDAAGVVSQLDSNIAADEGRFLYDLVADHNISRTLEVGMAYGVSSMYIAQAHMDNLHKGPPEAGSLRHHIAIDPFQSTQWRGIGSLNLMRSGLRGLVRHVEEKSHFALPKICQTSGEGAFGLVFIDGMHLYDFTLVDFFYADLLVPPGGFVVFDDAQMPSVQRVIAYVLSNRAYDQIDLSGRINHLDRMIALRKKHDDTREWDFHTAF